MVNRPQISANSVERVRHSNPNTEHGIRNFDICLVPVKA